MIEGMEVSCSRVAFADGEQLGPIRVSNAVRALAYSVHIAIRQWYSLNLRAG
jgi:hypothetical protein